MLEHQQFQDVVCGTLVFSIMNKQLVPCHTFQAWFLLGGREGFRLVFLSTSPHLTLYIVSISNQSKAELEGISIFVWFCFNIILEEPKMSCCILK